ncbi:alkaline phosphatase [Halarcobacter mediterraneus]|uniref:Alkaline phosphatase n=1 Tax=Halarcobacter mediterraneus TaxID=2023153 RepID=A0A4Q1AXY5_9BACT|nr:alkaline phosphatase D family protein [Halarcobacter mediterraneus]RXK13220.1 alkaline phosphatase [Halarcobacter mediterraneus]
MKFTRRDFLKISALSFYSIVVSTGLSACGSNSNSTNVDFLHGVASGDPTEDSVIIWTRLTPENNLNELSLSYEVSKFEDFSTLIHSGDAKAKKDNDYTVKIDLQNLESDKEYYYRFKANDKVSVIGKTKTISSNPSQVKMAVFSCSNYPNGYFNAYMEASKIQDLDVVLHLGDYIYEYGMFEADGLTPAYATKNAVEIGRALPSDNDTELLTIEDYRKRYALYRTDEGLQALHKKVPFITVWDDHEIANDTYKDGAQNHNNDTEGDFQTRKMAALKAYFEWLPIRAYEEDNNEIIYRNFEFGDLVSLYMLDTRVLSRDKQLNYSNYFDKSANFDSVSFSSDLLDSSRTMLGNEQLLWLQNKLSTSASTWQVLGQQVLMGRMFLPAELLTSISQLENDLTDEQKLALLTQLNEQVSELVSIKTRILSGGSTVSEEEALRLNTTLPYNLDAWDGYFYEREVLLGTSLSLGKNLIVLSGDTHNSWANELKDSNGNSVGVEYAVTSVSSPGMEDYAGLTSMDSAKAFENAISFLIDDLKYTNLNQRGFMTVTFTEDEATTNWYYLDNYASTNYSLDASRQVSLKTLVNTNKIV